MPKTKKQVKKKSFSVIQITVKTWRLLWDNRKVFLGISLVYGLLNVVLVRGFASGNFSGTKANFTQALSGHTGSLTSSIGSFVSAITSAGTSTNAASAAYQSFIILISSLAIIWALRHVMAKDHISVKDAFYKGTYPLVQFILVAAVIGLQLLPLALGSTLYVTVVGGGIAINLLEQIFWLVMFVLLAGISMYLITSSMIALYIVTLPDMTPIRALKNAKNLVTGRRIFVLRKLLFLPLLLAVLLTVILLPFALLIPGLAKIFLFIASVLMLPVAHAYMYTLYRELVDE